MQAANADSGGSDQVSPAANGTCDGGEGDDSGGGGDGDPDGPRRRKPSRSTTSPPRSRASSSSPPDPDTTHRRASIVLLLLAGAQLATGLTLVLFDYPVAGGAVLTHAVWTLPKLVQHLLKPK